MTPIIDNTLLQQIKDTLLEQLKATSSYKIEARMVYPDDVVELVVTLEVLDSDHVPWLKEGNDV